MKNLPVLTYALLASVDIPPARILVQDGDASCAPAGADLTVVPIGVSQQDAPAKAGRPCDVVALGVAPVEYGGNVAVGDPLTSDADGRAVKADPADGAQSRVVGFAAEAGDEGTIGSVSIAIQVITGVAAA